MLSDNSFELPKVKKHYVDVHTHLTHQAFVEDWEAVVERAREAGLTAIVVNGLEPISNRQVLAMAAKYPVIKPALGIYPLEAINSELVPGQLPFEISQFSVEEELSFIREQALSGRLAAIGECGLDAHWLDDRYSKGQEFAFEHLIETSILADIPIIVHSRKKEQRCRDILKHHGAKRVNFHCFGGRTRLAKKIAEEDGYWFSIPANAVRSESFRKMLSELPIERILTETDAPFLSKVKGERTEPRDVCHTIALLAELRTWSEEDACLRVWNNYQELFES
jgi:TatD DNase family protein